MRDKAMYFPMMTPRMPTKDKAVYRIKRRGLDQYNILEPNHQREDF